MRRPLSLLVLGNRCAGAENQCLGLAESLQERLESSTKRAVRQSFRRILPIARAWEVIPPSAHVLISGLRKKWNWIGLENFDAKEASKNSDLCHELIQGPYPDVVIASGRTTVPACVAYRRASGGKTFTVQIQHPRCDLGLFDAVVIPVHDLICRLSRLSRNITSFEIDERRDLFEMRQSNIIPTMGSVHSVNQKSLLRSWNEQGLLLEPFTSQIGRKVVAVLIGGPTSRCTWDQPSFFVALDNLLQVCRERVSENGFSILISLSRRSPSGLLNEVMRWKDYIVNNDRSVSVFVWDPAVQTKPLNPYQAMLFIADLIVVTADSVGMCSEACSTGKPVVVLLSDRCIGKLRFFHDSLRHFGYTTCLEEHSPLPCFPICPVKVLDDTGTVSRLLLPRILEHQDRIGCA